MVKARLTRSTTTLKFPCHYQNIPNLAFKLLIFVTYAAQMKLLLHFSEGSGKGTELLSSAFSLNSGQRLASTLAIYALSRHLEP